MFNHNVARIDLGQATGTIQAMLRREPAGESGQPVMPEPKIPLNGAVNGIIRQPAQETRIPAIFAGSSVAAPLWTAPGTRAARTATGAEGYNTPGDPIVWRIAGSLPGKARRATKTA